MKQILLSSSPEETQLAVMEDGKLTDFAMERAGRDNLVGRIYKGVVRNVTPDLKGIFVDIGVGQNAFLRVQDLPGKEVPTEGKSLLVQVVRDSTATKGPAVTGKISFSGRYAVALTDTDYIGVSKKIRSEEKRALLRKEGKALSPEGMGLIIRTAAEKAGLEEVRADIRRLKGRWETLMKRSRMEKAPALLYREGDLVVRCFRDYVTDDTDEVIVDSAGVQDRLHDMAGEEGGGKEDIIFLHTDTVPLMKAYHAAEQIHLLFEREVPLPGGGSLIFDYAEALTAIDVNSGSFRGRGMSHNDMACLVNREACGEIARQIRMRGIGGMILIDFIDMAREEDKEAIVKTLREAVQKDRVKTVVCGMTSLGLVEMTRKRTAHRLWQSCYDTCPVCHGTGRILSAESVAIAIKNDLTEKARAHLLREDILIECHKDVAAILRKEEAEERLSSRFNRAIHIEEGNHPDRAVYTISACHSD